MASQWHVQIAGRTHGPYSDSQLEQLMQSGRITPETLVRRGSSGGWCAASELPELFGSPTEADEPDVNALIDDVLFKPERSQRRTAAEKSAVVTQNEYDLHANGDNESTARHAEPNARNGRLARTPRLPEPTDKVPDYEYMRTYALLLAVFGYLSLAVAVVCLPLGIVLLFGEGRNVAPEVLMVAVSAVACCIGFLVPAQSLIAFRDIARDVRQQRIVIQQLVGYMVERDRQQASES